MTEIANSQSARICPNSTQKTKLIPLSLARLPIDLIFTPKKTETSNFQGHLPSFQRFRLAKSRDLAYKKQKSSVFRKKYHNLLLALSPCDIT